MTAPLKTEHRKPFSAKDKGLSAFVLLLVALFFVWLFTVGKPEPIAYKPKNVETAAIIATTANDIG